jgi:hypothetical protein
MHAKESDGLAGQGSFVYYCGFNFQQMPKLSNILKIIINNMTLPGRSKLNIVISVDVALTTEL